MNNVCRIPYESASVRHVAMRIELLEWKRYAVTHEPCWSEREVRRAIQLSFEFCGCHGEEGGGDVVVRGPDNRARPVSEWQERKRSIAHESLPGGLLV